MKNIVIRLEEPKDYRTVEELTRAAFNNPDRIDRSKINCPMEHHMVHQLRKKDGIMELNFVAEMDGRIVGHIIYSHAHILQSDGEKIDVLNFGPISVWPDLQRTGIGSALMKHSIKEATKLGYGAILFFGHPEYYPRFGFVEAKEFGITDCGGNNYPAFMAMELKESFLKNVFGKFIEAEIYNDDLNREQAKEFDKHFHAAIKGISHITFIVKDLGRSTLFFEKIFGAREVYASGNKIFSLSKEKFFLINDLWICVMEGESLLDRTYNHIAFQISENDIDDYINRIKSIGAEIRTERPRIDGEGRSVYFYDFDNHLFELHTGTLEERLDRYSRKT